MKGEWTGEEGPQTDGTNDDAALLENKAKEVCDQLDTFWTNKTLKEMYFVRDVRRLPVLLAISSLKPSGLLDKTRQLVREFHQKANKVVDVATNNAAWGGEEAADRLWKAQALVSQLYHANSALAMMVPGLVRYLEAPSRWTETYDVDDGDGLTLKLDITSAAAAGVDEELLEEVKRQAEGVGLLHQRELGGGVTVCLIQVCVRIVGIDTAEWYQCFLVTKAGLRYLRDELGWVVRIVKVYYSDDDGVASSSSSSSTTRCTTPRWFAEVRIGPKPITATSSPQSALVQEVSLRHLLLALGITFRMPSYEFVEDASDAKRGLELFSLAQKRLAAHGRGYQGEGQPQDVCAYLGAQWAVMMKHDSFQYIARIFSYGRGQGGRDITVEDFEDALDPWYRHGFVSVHMTKPGQTFSFDRQWVENQMRELHMPELPPPLNNRPPVQNRRTFSDAIAKRYAWWKHASDWQRFGEQVVWGPPHEAKKLRR